jgi:hypothetical protein
MNVSTSDWSQSPKPRGDGGMDDEDLGREGDSGTVDQPAGVVDRLWVDLVVWR